MDNRNITMKLIIPADDEALLTFKHRPITVRPRRTSSTRPRPTNNGGISENILQSLRGLNERDYTTRYLTAPCPSYYKSSLSVDTWFPNFNKAVTALAKSR